MKIAHIVSTFPPYHGGMGNSVAGMASALAARGHEVTVVTPNYELGMKNQGDRDSIIHDSLFMIHHLWPLLKIGNAALLPQLLWNLQGYDIVHLHYPFFGGAEFVTLWKQFVLYPRPCPLVVSYHMDAVADGWKGKFFAWHTAHIMPWILDRADRIVVTTADYAAHSLLREHVELQSKIVAIPHGVDIKRFGHSAQASAAHGSVLFVGALDQAHAFKGVDVLLRAFTFVVEFSGEDARRLVIVGDGDCRPTYEALAHELGIAAHVYFAGSVSDDDLPSYYAAATCVVLPSTNASEAFGMVLLEAMAAEKPVIASNVPGVRSVVVEGETGLLVKPGDIVGLGKALITLLEDAQSAHAMGAAGRRRALKEYTWDRVGQFLEKTYQELL